MNELPIISIIIPTYKSEKVLPVCLESIKSQDYPKDKIEIIVVDGGSADKTLEIAKQYTNNIFQIPPRTVETRKNFVENKTGNKIIAIMEVNNIPPKKDLKKRIYPQVCAQRNLGAEIAKGDYLFFLDHDMEMSKNLLKNFAEKVANTTNNIDAWYVPERIVGNNLWRTIRNFDREFYNYTIIDAIRIIKKGKFDMSEKYDIMLSSGPADWDLDIQLKEMGCKLGIIDECVYHHEEHLSLWKYLTKKGKYANGGDVYQKKWKKRNKKVYNNIIKKQYSAYYRLIGVFVENGKWKKTIRSFHIYFFLLFVKLLVGMTYMYNRRFLFKYDK